MSALRYPTDAFRSYCLAKIAETGEVVEGNSRGSTATLLFKRLAELGIEPANREAYFANAICDALPDDRACRECRYLDDSAPDILRQPRSLGLQDIMRFLKSMASWVASGGGFVSQEEAERRASICCQCPLNQEMEGCFGCSGAAALMETITDRTTSKDGQLKNCRACGCVSKVAVHFPLSAVDTSVEYPAHCWKAATPNGK